MKISLETPTELSHVSHPDKSGVIFDTEYIIVDLHIDPETLCGVFLVAPKNQEPSIAGKQAMLTTLYSALGNAIERWTIIRHTDD